MSFSLSNYVHHTPERMFRAANRAARGVSANEWELGAWLLAIERTRAYRSSGFRNTVGYAVACLGVEAQKAWNLIRIMGVLEGHPRLSNSFRTGKIGYAKIREVTRVVTPETESAWIEFALSHNTDQVRQRVVSSPAAFERRVRSIRNQADSLFSRRTSPEETRCPSHDEVNCPQPTGLITSETQVGRDPGDRGGFQPEALSLKHTGGSPAAPTGQSGTPMLPDCDREQSAEPGLRGCVVSSSVAPPEHMLFSVERDGLPAPQRVRLVIELGAEEYAEWGAMVERVSRQLGHRASNREVLLELARRHVASTGGSSLQRNPVVVRLEPDGSGYVQTDRGPLAVNRQSQEEYLGRASSIVAPGSQASVLLLGGRRRKRLPSDVLRALVARSEGCCESCSQRGLLHIHHIRPLSRGGTNALENLRLLCSACHGREHVQDFKPGSDWERARERRRRTQTGDSRRARAGGADP